MRGGSQVRLSFCMSKLEGVVGGVGKIGGGVGKIRGGVGKIRGGVGKKLLNVSVAAGLFATSGGQGS